MLPPSQSARRRAAADSPFAPTSQRLAAGEALYQQHCALCHGQTMGGGEAGPPLRGRAFTRKWNGQSQALFELTRRTMPVTQPGGLSQSAYAQLTALMINGGAPTVAGSPDAATTAQPALPPVPDTEWLHHRGDAGSRNYSALAQIDAGNVARLQVAWRWRSDNFGPSIWPNLADNAADGARHAVCHGRQLPQRRRDRCAHWRNAVDVSAR